MNQILLIDDDEDFRKPLHKALCRVGYAVEAVADSNAALRLFRQRSFDLVITDLIMPGTEGIETIVALRRLRPDIKIIAISGGGILGCSIPLDMAQKLGASRALAKPFKLDDMLRAIAESLPAQPEPASP